MNISVISLSAKSLLSSPYFMSSLSSSRKSNIFYKTNYFNSFSSFYKTYSTNSKFIQSRFHKILSPAVVISNYQQTFQTINQFTKVSDNKIEISRCVFSDIENQDKSTNGGAILCDNQETIVNIERTGFIYCKCASKGGAVYFNCKNVNMTMSCFEENRALDGCQAYYIESPDISLDDMIISECGLKQNHMILKTSEVSQANVNIKTSNYSSNRKVLFEGGLSFRECVKADVQFTLFSNNLGNGLFHIETKEISRFDSCNVINNTGSESSPLLLLNVQKIDFNKITFAKNSIPTFLEIAKAHAILFSNCRFDTSLLDFGYYEQIQITLCKFEQTNPNLVRIKDPLQFRCYALSATDPPDIFIPQILPKKETFFAEPSKFEIPENKAPTFNWMPPGMLAKTYGLILFASIITPIFIVIHCITSKGSREIRALN